MLSSKGFISAQALKDAESKVEPEIKNKVKFGFNDDSDEIEEVKGSKAKPKFRNIYENEAKAAVDGYQ